MGSRASAPVEAGEEVGLLTVQSEVATSLVSSGASDNSDIFHDTIDEDEDIMLCLDPPDIHSAEIRDITGSYKRKVSEILEITRALENHCGSSHSNRELIVPVIEEIAKKMRKVEWGIFGTISGVVLAGYGGSVTGIVGGSLFIAGVTGPVGAIVMASVAGGLGVVAAGVSVGTVIGNYFYKKGKFKSVDDLVKEDRDHYEFIKENLVSLERLKSECESFVQTVGEKWEELWEEMAQDCRKPNVNLTSKIQQLAEVEAAKDWCELLWAKVTNRVMRLNRNVPGFNAFIEGGTFRVRETVTTSSFGTFSALSKSVGPAVEVSGRAVAISPRS